MCAPGEECGTGDQDDGEEFHDPSPNQRASASLAPRANAGGAACFALGLGLATEPVLHRIEVVVGGRAAPGLTGGPPDGVFMKIVARSALGLKDEAEIYNGARDI